jgi:hypothetical protein
MSGAYDTPYYENPRMDFHNKFLEKSAQMVMPKIWQFSI